MIPIEKIRNEGKEIKAQVRQQTLSYVVAALSLVAGLAWNDFIKKLIDVFFPLKKDSLWVGLLYAVAITLIVVVITVYLTKILKPKGEDEQ